MNHFQAEVFTPLLFVVTEGRRAAGSYGFIPTTLLTKSPIIEVGQKRQNKVEYILLKYKIKKINISIT
ncbi:hypothetical protein [Sutcliffiella rhizosphaerae]|uniref:hypothetical protein n=1 Tax=Sutcliffiella rhizosphaerae TaxID=2880967 RepID=UPI001E528746|nr:hypothetical protein [Sutcliffiella rhizosphaerae]